MGATPRWGSLQGSSHFHLVQPDSRFSVCSTARGVAVASWMLAAEPPPVAQRCMGCQRIFDLPAHVICPTCDGSGIMRTEPIP